MSDAEQRRDEDRRAEENAYQCQGLFKNGNRCTKTIAPGMVWCHRHVPYTGDRLTMWQMGITLASATQTVQASIRSMEAYEDVVADRLPEGTLRELKTVGAQLSDITDRLYNPA